MIRTNKYKHDQTSSRNVAQDAVVVTGSTANSLAESKRVGQTDVPMDDTQTLPVGADRVANRDIDRGFLGTSTAAVTKVDAVDRRRVVDDAATAAENGFRYRADHTTASGGDAGAIAKRSASAIRQKESIDATPGAFGGMGRVRLGLIGSFIVGAGDAAIQAYLWTRNEIPVWLALVMAMLSAGSIVFVGKSLGEALAHERMLRRNGAKPPQNLIGVDEFYGPEDPKAIKQAIILAALTAVFLPLSMTAIGTSYGDPFGFAFGLAVLTAVGILGAAGATIYGYNPVVEKQHELSREIGVLKGLGDAIKSTGALAAGLSTRASMNNVLSELSAKGAANMSAAFVHEVKSAQPELFGYLASTADLAAAGLAPDGTGQGADFYTAPVTFMVPTVDLTVRTVDDESEQGRLFRFPGTAA